MRKPRGIWRSVVALAAGGMYVSDIARICDVGESYVRATCRRKAMPLKGKREWKSQAEKS